MDRGNFRDMLAVVLVLASFQISSGVPEKIQEHTLVEKASLLARPSISKIHELKDQALEVRLLQKRIFSDPRSEVSEGRADLEPESQKPFAADANLVADMPEHFLQKKWFMSGTNGRDAPEDRDKSETKLAETKNTYQKTVQTPKHFLQKRIFMRGDTPEHRETYIAEKPETKLTEHSAQKRWFMSGTDNGRDAPEQRQPFPRAQVTQERRMYEHPVLPKDDSENASVSSLKKLLILRDRVKAIHEKLDEVIESYRSSDDDAKSHGKELDDPQAKEWEKILNSFETD